MSTRSHWSYRQILAATLLSSGIMPIGLPAFAQTAPGTPITNQATATYSDGANSYNATSNTVTISVAEIAGITLVAQPPSTTAPIADDTFTVPFVITNKGNDPTTFEVPGIATLSDSTDFTVTSITIIKVNGATVSIPIAIGATTIQTASVPKDGTVIVEVKVKVNGNAPAGANTTVTLGKTIPETLQTGVPYVADSGSVHTKDNPDTVTGEYPGVLAIASEKEAMDTSAAITVKGRLQAYATILKVNSAYDSKTPGLLTDDLLTYELALRVEDPSSPPFGVVSDLNATQIKLDSGSGVVNVNKILISDAIPAGTQLSNVIPTAPNGWTPIYSTTALTSTALQADWTTIKPALNLITRVGFSADGAIVKGTTLRNFKFSVNPLSTFKGGQIANIAQVFGQSQPGAVVPGTGTQLVYDESGDQSSNNELIGSNPDSATTGGIAVTNGGISTGEAKPGEDGTDLGTLNTFTNNDPTNPATNIGVNTGAGSGIKINGGDDTIFTIAATPLNGPANQPAAKGPNATGTDDDNNNDFTNKAVSPPIGLDPTALLTDAQTPDVVFVNTVQNTSASSQTIVLIPLPPAVKTDLPNGTKVTIDSDGTGTIATLVTFTYDQATGVFTPDGAVPSVIVPAGGTPSYGVIINLGDNAAQNIGYSVPIAAFIDTDGNGQYDNTKEPGNLTLDRAYTGYVSLKKEARILEANGTTQVAGFTTASTTAEQQALNAAALPGRIIEYRITYTNLSSGQGSGANNVTLPANNLQITEDGTTAPNNWFTTTKDTNPTNTAQGSGLDPTGAVIATFSGADVQTYIDTVSALAPGAIGEFKFRRQIK